MATIITREVGGTAKGSPLTNAEIDNNFIALNTAKAEVASPALTGTPTAPTAAAGTNTTQLATTAFVTAADNLKANIASPVFTGQVILPEGTAASPGLSFQNDGGYNTGLYHAGDDIIGVSCGNTVVASFTITGLNLAGVPTAPTAAAGTNTTQLATTAFVTSADNLKANIASPTFTGKVIVPQGSAANPGLAFTGDISNDTGLYLNADGNLGVTCNGSQVASFTSGALTLQGTATGTSFNGITALASTIPLASGTATVGTSTAVARQDHVHPLQTTLSASSPITTVVPAKATTIAGATSGSINVPEVTLASGELFATALHQVTTVTGGYRQHISIGSYRAGTNTYAGGCFVGVGNNDNNPTEYYSLGLGGNITHSSGSTFWNNLNDGAGSGLDADLLDGHDSTYFLAAADGEAIRFNATGTGNTYTEGGVELRGNGSTNTVKPTIGFHQPGLFAGTLNQEDGSLFAFKKQDGSAANLLINALYQTNPRASDNGRGYITTNDPRGYANATKFVTLQSPVEFYGITQDYQSIGAELSLVSNYVNGTITFSTGSKGNTAAISDANLVMRMHANGNITVGTPTDNGTDKLQVTGSVRAGAITATGRITGTTGSGSGGGFGFDSDTGMVSSGDGNLKFYTNNVYAGGPVTGTNNWDINITGSASSATNATNATNATSAVTSTYTVSPDGNRDAGTKLPTTSGHTVRYDFANGNTAGNPGSTYCGVMTYAPWDGTTGSTGSQSYQLSFGSNIQNTGTVPVLQIRNGIDSAWNQWCKIWHSGNSPFLNGINGFQIFPSGMIIQWGRTVFQGSGSIFTNMGVSFPIVFPNLLASLSIVGNDTSVGSQSQEGYFSCVSKSNGSFVINYTQILGSGGGELTGFDWIAIGF